MCPCPSRVRPARTRARLTVRQLPLSARPPTSASSSCRAPSRTSPNQFWETSEDLGDLVPQPTVPRVLSSGRSPATLVTRFFGGNRIGPRPYLPSPSLYWVCLILCVFSVAFPWVLWFIFLKINKRPLFFPAKKQNRHTSRVVLSQHTSVTVRAVRSAQSTNIQRSYHGARR